MVWHDRLTRVREGITRSWVSRLCMLKGLSELLSSQKVAPTSSSSTFLSVVQNGDGGMRASGGGIPSDESNQLVIRSDNLCLTA
jgi:hypothetical protein